jgi:hypothetical protein
MQARCLQDLYAQVLRWLSLTNATTLEVCVTSSVQLCTLCDWFNVRTLGALHFCAQLYHHGQYYGMLAEHNMLINHLVMTYTYSYLIRVHL